MSLSPSHDRPARADAVSRILELAAQQRPLLAGGRMICIDGPAGAGKTTLSADLLLAARASNASARVVHLDDTYGGWQQDLRALGGRLRNDLVGPLASGHAGRYRRFDWHSYTFQEWVSVSRTDLLILEGVGSSHRNLASRRAVLVWVDAPTEVCLSRGITRDGEERREQWLSWKQREVDFFRSFEPQLDADVVVLTATVQ